MDGLVYAGKIVQIDPIPDADFIVSVTVVCGKGGKWRGVARKGDFRIDQICLVFLPDAQLPEYPQYEFMRKHKHRVRLCRFRGAPSEVLIMPTEDESYHPGTDLTASKGVTKYFKPIPACLDMEIIGHFPASIPKTDEPNYQGVPQLLRDIRRKPYYITEKLDGSSTTAYRNEVGLHVCSRNYEIKEDERNGYWRVANRYDLKNRLPLGIAIQWETCGPGINGNHLKLKEVEGFIFSAWDMAKHSYLEYRELMNLVDTLKMPMVKVIEGGNCMTCDSTYLQMLSSEKHTKETPKEGIVVRSQKNVLGHAPISFKVINLDYET
jgi:RNA ligase (TIGR02306 family)